MRKSAVLLIAALVAASCSQDVTEPADTLSSLDAGAILAYDAAGLSGPGRYLAGLHRLPDNLKLSADQEAKIKALLVGFQETNKVDIEALAKINEEAKSAIRAGKSREEVAAIMARGDAIRARLDAAEKALQTAIEGVLTAEQKAWLDANQPKRCEPGSAPALTDAQRTQIRALIAAYDQANKADLDAVQAALERARAAQKNGASKAEIQAILDSVKANMDRLRVAQVELAKAIDALLTAEQRASACFKAPPIPGPVVKVPAPTRTRK
jgi:Spy/CpxP family protein refolding chaperone